MFRSPIATRSLGLPIEAKEITSSNLNKNVPENITLTNQNSNEEHNGLNDTTVIPTGKETSNGIFNLSEKVILNQLMRIKNASGAANLLKTLYKKVRNTEPEHNGNDNYSISDKTDSPVKPTVQINSDNSNTLLEINNTQYQDLQCRSTDNQNFSQNPGQFIHSSTFMPKRPNQRFSLSDPIEVVQGLPSAEKRKENMAPHLTGEPINQTIHEINATMKNLSNFLVNVSNTLNNTGSITETGVRTSVIQEIIKNPPEAFQFHASQSLVTLFTQNLEFYIEERSNLNSNEIIKVISKVFKNRPQGPREAISIMNNLPGDYTNQSTRYRAYKMLVKNFAPHSARIFEALKGHETLIDLYIKCRDTIEFSSTRSLSNYEINTEIFQKICDPCNKLVDENLREKLETEYCLRDIDLSSNENVKNFLKVMEKLRQNQIYKTQVFNLNNIQHHEKPKVHFSFNQPDIREQTKRQKFENKLPLSCTIPGCDGKDHIARFCPNQCKICAPKIDNRFPNIPYKNHLENMCKLHPKN